MPGAHDYLVAYIGGSGRSGSTILDMMLGGNSNAFSTGQIDELRRWIDTDRHCTCGELLSDCPFWSGVLRSDGFGVPAALNASGRVRKFVGTLRAITTGPTEGKSRDVAVTWTVFTLVAARAGKRVVVDSSKAALRAALLASGPERSRIRLVHLVRDPRGYVTSRSFSTRAESAQGAVGYTAAQSKPVALADWLAQNLLTLAVGVLAFRGRYAVVTYEDLTRDPEGTLAYLSRFMGMEYQPSMLPPLDRADFHLVGGNSSRLAFSELRYDERWRSKLGSREKLLIGIAGGWLYRLLAAKAARRSPYRRAQRQSTRALDDECP